jgi:hypothetical protein
MMLRDDKSRLNQILEAAHKAVECILYKNRKDLDSDKLLSLAIARLPL